MKLFAYLKDFWAYLKKDSWHSWLVSLLLTFLVIKFVFFPVMGFVTGTSLPLVVVESCSMYHSSDFDEWWQRQGVWYEKVGIEKEDFEGFGFKNGLNKGDVVLVWGHGGYNIGDVIIFNSNFKYPLIHRMIQEDPVGTKGDNNLGQLDEEKRIQTTQIIGKGVLRIPAIGWLKLIFYESNKPEGQKGFCK